MIHCGADVHSKSTHLTILSGRGVELFSGPVPTERVALQAALRPYAKKGVRVIQETGASQAFIQSVFGEIGIDVVTVHASDMKMITRSKKKTDKRDSYQLAWHSLKDNLPEPVYVPTQEEQDLRALLSAHERARKGRTALSNGVRGQLKRYGILLPQGFLTKESGWTALHETDLSPAMRIIVEASFAMWMEHTRAMELLSAEMRERTKEDDLVRRLKTIPNVGDGCAVAVRAYLADLRRFHGRRAVVSYAGFCPSQHDTGDRHVTGRITKQGPSRIRAVFVQAAHLLIGRKFKGLPHWRGWYERLLHAKDRRNKAVVAVARRLYLLAYQVGRSGDVYRPPAEEGRN